jgi:hypothetical protein
VPCNAALSNKAERAKLTEEIREKQSTRPGCFRQSDLIHQQQNDWLAKFDGSQFIRLVSFQALRALSES